MENKSKTSAWRVGTWKRVLCMLLTVITVVGLLPVTAKAEDIWDGSGSGGSGNGVTVTGSFKLESTTAYYSIMGYRFTVHDASGNRVEGSLSIDMDIRSRAPSRVSLASRKSHVELYQLYQIYEDGGLAPSLGSFSSAKTEANGVYDATDIEALTATRTASGDGPSAIGDWLGTMYDSTQTWADYIAKIRCGVSGYSEATHYIIVEPVYYVVLGDVSYGMTMAELAVYQSRIVESARKSITNTACYPITGLVESTSTMNVRSGPGTGYSKVGSLASADVVEILEYGTYNSQTWAKINYADASDGSGIGWVRAGSGYVAIIELDTTVDKPIAATITHSSGVNVRSGPGSSNTLLGTIAKGTVVAVEKYETYNSTRWGLIDYNGSEGWICVEDDYLDLTISYKSSSVDGWTHTSPHLKAYNPYLINIGRFTSAVFGRWLYAE